MEDPWFTQNKAHAKQALESGEFQKAENLYKSMWDEACIRMERETKFETGIHWIQALIHLSRFEDALTICDELESELEEGKTPTAVVRLTCQRAVCAYYLGNYTDVVNICEAVLTIPEAQNVPYELARIHNSLALAFRHLRHFDKAIEHFKEAKLILRKYHLEDTGSFDGNLGLVYEDMGRYVDAAEFYQVAVSKTKKTGHKTSEIRWSGMLGSCYHILGEYQKAEEVLTEYLACARDMGLIELSCVLLTLLAELESDLDNFADSFEHVSMAIELAEEHKLEVRQAYARIKRGQILIEHGGEASFSQALEDAHIGRDILEKLKVRSGLFDAFALEAEVLFHLTRIDDALVPMKEALRLCEDDELSVARVVFTAGLVFEAKGDSDKSKTMFLRAHRIIMEEADKLPEESRRAFFNRRRNKKILDKLS